MDENGEMENGSRGIRSSVEKAREIAISAVEKGRGKVQEKKDEALARVTEAEQIQEVQKRVNEAAQLARRAKDNPVGAGVDVLVRTREMRKEMEEKNKKKGLLAKIFGKTVRRVGGSIILEYLNPISISTTEAYGPGDIVALYCWRTGRDFYTGDQLDEVDKKIYLLGALIPWFPAGITVEVAQRLRRRAENAAYLASKLSPQKSPQDE